MSRQQTIQRQGIRLEGLLISIHSPNPMSLQMNVDGSRISDAEYMKLVAELEEALIEIDVKHRKYEKRLIQQRSLTGRFRLVQPNPESKTSKIKQERRFKILKFSPFPATLTVSINNLRTSVYKAVNEHCVVLQRMEHGTTYLLPDSQGTAFMDKVDKVNIRVRDVRGKVRAYQDDKDFARVLRIISSHGVTWRPEEQEKNGRVFEVRDFEVDFARVNLSPSTVKEHVDQRIQKEMERTQRDLIMNALTDIRQRLVDKAREITNKKRLDPDVLKQELAQLQQLTTDIGLGEMAAPVIAELSEASENPDRLTGLAELPKQIDGRIAGLIKEL